VERSKGGVGKKKYVDQTSSQWNGASREVGSEKTLLKRKDCSRGKQRPRPTHKREDGQSDLKRKKEEL